MVLAMSRVRFFHAGPAVGQGPGVRQIGVDFAAATWLKILKPCLACLRFFLDDDIISIHFRPTILMENVESSWEILSIGRR